MKRILNSLFSMVTIFIFLPTLLLSSGGISNSSTQIPIESQEYPISQNVTKLSVQADLDWGKMPVYFIENCGQLDASVLYYVQGSDKTLYFTRTGVTFALTGEIKDAAHTAERKSEDLAPVTDATIRPFSLDSRQANYQITKSPDRWTVKLDFLDANDDVFIEAQEMQSTIVSYFKGPIEDWHAGLQTYTRLVYHDLWPGIDLVYQGTTDRLKYEFVVQPGADPRQIQLEYRGATGVKINDLGQMEVSTPLGGFHDDTPIAYQEVNAKRVEVAMAYALAPSLVSTQVRFSFELGDYDQSHSLVLDPAVLIYCGYIGGAGDDGSYGIAVDSGKSSFVTGYTTSSETTFPVISGPDLTFNGNYDTFVAKVQDDGSGLVYIGYIGGSDYEWGSDIAVDSDGSAYVIGYTSSNENTFPVIVGPDLTFNGVFDAFVAKVRVDGTGLVYAGYLGGSDWDDGIAIAVDNGGAAYVIGRTASSEATFPVIGGPDLTYNGGNYDAFVAKVKEDGSCLIFAGYIGGSSYDSGSNITVDDSGTAYVTGRTASSEATFPVIGGPDMTYNGGGVWGDAFVAKVGVDGMGLIYAGYIGGSGEDGGVGIAVDSDGAAYVTGWTKSSEITFPVVNGPDLTFNGDYDVFVAKVQADGGGLVYAGYIGGSGNDQGESIAVDGDGEIYLTGLTSSNEATFPVVRGPDLTYNGGNYDAFVAKVQADGGGLVYAGYIGGSDWDAGFSIAVDGSGAAYLTGYTESSEASFPVIGGPDLTFNELADSFVAKVTYQYAYIFLPVLVR